jgi:predicted DCC family thiol-disulfide oxidoreductase YuxK
MKQKIITLSIVALIAGLLSIVVFVSNHQEKQSVEQKVTELKKTDPVLYYGNTCPHCEIVEEWLVKNDVASKMAFSNKEVYDNKENAAELTQVAMSCGLDANNIGVPFLYAQGECLIGSPAIINYFAQKLNINVTSNPEASAAAVDLNN